MISLSFHLFEYTQKIGERGYKFQTKGGRIMVLGLIAGFLARHFGYIDWGTWGIIGASVAACLIWDVLTAISFFRKMKKKAKKVGEILEVLPKDGAVWVIDADVNGGHGVYTHNYCVQTFDTAEHAKQYAKSHDEISNAIYVQMHLGNIYNKLKDSETSAGIRYHYGDASERIWTEDLLCFANVFDGFDVD